jgi:hypothetical protein
MSRDEKVLTNGIQATAPNALPHEFPERSRRHSGVPLRSHPPARLNPHLESRLRFSVAHEFGLNERHQPRISIVLLATAVLPSGTKTMTQTRNTVNSAAANAEENSAFHEEQPAP